MLQCDLPSLYYVGYDKGLSVSTSLKIFEKYIQIPITSTDLLKIDGAEYKDNKTKMVLKEPMQDWPPSAAMLGWYGASLQIDASCEDGVFLPTWTADVLTDFNDIVSGNLEEYEKNIFIGKVWQRSQIPASQETIDKLKRGIESGELSPIINYSLPISQLSTKYPNQNACYLLDEVVYYVQGINKSYNSVRIDDGRMFKSEDIVAVPIVLKDIFCQQDNEGKWIGCSEDFCSGVSYFKKQEFFEKYLDSFRLLQREMKKLKERGEVRATNDTEFQKLKIEYDCVQRELEKYRTMVAAQEEKQAGREMQQKKGQGGRCE